MKLGIVGNVAIDRRQAELAWTLISGIIHVWEPSEIWSGGATGIDSIAEECAKLHGYFEDDKHGCIQGGTCPGCTSGCWRTGPLVVCRPDVQAWDPVGRRGFKARNLEIINGVDRLVRVSKHTGGDRTYGSGWTADQAEERLGQESVYRYYI